ncbi:MAG: RIP metalloprotease RseP [Syntrophobacteraceae bacterium]
MVTTILSTIVVLGVLIFIHELGHFLVAKWAGVTVLRFSLGFGPRLIGIKRGDTDYCLSLIPLGGYVKMLGEEPGEELTSEQLAGSFSSQPVSKRFAIVLAGPLSNFLLAIVIFTFVYAFSGIPQLTTEIGGISAGSPAEQAGLQAGDKVLTINAKPILNWDELSETIEVLGVQPLSIEVQRGEEVQTLKVVPRVSEVKNLFGEMTTRPVIGVTASGKTSVLKVNPLYAGYYSVAQTLKLCKLFLTTIVKLIERVIPLQTLGGPILIAQMAGQQASEGLLNLIYFTALISVNLAVLNLLPIPVLDGGHILFYLIEALLGRPIAVKKIEMAQKIGMALLLVLMLVVFYNDIMRLLPGHKPDFMP